jgi:hypothetical protein
VVEKSEGAAVAGLHRFIDSPLSSFIFLWACFYCRPSISLFRTIVSSVWLLYNILRGESLFREEEGEGQARRLSLIF